MKPSKTEAWIWGVICWGWRRILKTLAVQRPVFGRNRKKQNVSVGQGVCLKVHSSHTGHSSDIEQFILSTEKQSALAPLVSLAQKGVVVQFHLENEQQARHVGSLIHK
ncbi:MAG: hypothetical protein G3M78_13260 [Candidatus Nitrohelix vancouverensis]|uniref:Uncharacterized protein n=1 Tax=Candidatus Nitrohelix vancouverensis TaxID=2705534 RepID=A0A7T0C4H4_9BACT|nr:MAG: hypothetical protein G3M78_13260 [Candidatus Nitrohelix vancouverensis]